MKVAIAGYGLEGKANLRYWQEMGADVTILDERPVTDAPEGVMVMTGVNALSDLSSFDIVIRTASLNPHKLTTAKKVWSATNEFFARCQAPIIGITGTKGKGTTSSIIASILRAAGKTVHLVGNIGIPALDVLKDIQPDHIVVFEMSSFQLWDLEKSPHVAIVLMVEPDHLDVHANMDEYVQAKSQIRHNQVAGDVCIYHPTNVLSKKIALSSTVSRPIRYGVADGGACYVQNGSFYIDGRVICKVSELRLVGQHNIENACAAISAASVYTEDALAIAAGLRSFDGLPHRTKFIREVDGVKYYDDNYSSAPGAAIAAIRSFTQTEILIMGGYDKHVDFAELAAAIKSQTNIRKVILIGQTRFQIAAALNAVGSGDIYELSDSTVLRPVVERARAIAKPGDVIIMSPACASFDMFKNFGDRGDQFIEIVESF